MKMQQHRKLHNGCSLFLDLHETIVNLSRGLDENFKIVFFLNF